MPPGTPTKVGDASGFIESVQVESAYGSAFDVVTLKMYVPRGVSVQDILGSPRVKEELKKQDGLKRRIVFED